MKEKKKAGRARDARHPGWSRHLTNVAVSAGAHSTLEICTSFWEIPQPLGGQCPPRRLLLTPRISRLP